MIRSLTKALALKALHQLDQLARDGYESARDRAYAADQRGDREGRARHQEQMDRCIYAAIIVRAKIEEMQG